MCQIYRVAQSYQSTVSPISAISTQLDHRRSNIRSRDLSKVPTEALKLGILAVKEAQCHVSMKPGEGEYRGWGTWSREGGCHHSQTIPEPRGQEGHCLEESY